MVKGLKDENAPKRPQTAYFMWMNDNRDKITKSMPDATFGEKAAKFSELWGAMSDGQKAPFVKKSTAASEKFHKAMAKYKLTADYKKFQKAKEEFKVNQVKKQKFKKDENAPTRPQSAYFLFMADERDDLVSGGMSHKDAVKKLGAMWSALSAGKKKPYDDKAASLKAKYEKAVEKYHKTSNYKKYMAEKEAFDAQKKADLKKANDKQKGKSASASKSKSRSRARSKSRSKSAKRAKRSKSRSKSKAKKRSRSKSKSKKRSRSRSKAKSKKRSKSRSRSRKKN